MTRTGHIISAKHIVVTEGVQELKTKEYRTYTIAARIKKNSVRKFLWWDTGDKKQKTEHASYHYVRIQKYDQNHDLLICGGQSHLIGQKSDMDELDRYVMLEGWMRERFPVQDVIYRWSVDGHEPENHIGYIGKKPGHDNVYVVSGDSGHGTMNATIAGLIIPDLINRKPNRWAAVYDPSYEVPSKISVAVNSFVRDSVSFIKNKMVKWGAVSTAGNAPADQDDPKAAVKEDVGTDGLHPSGHIFWNNDEESWDRLQQKRKLIYGQK
jgi:hypothetical protein